MSLHALLTELALVALALVVQCGWPGRTFILNGIQSNSPPEGGIRLYVKHLIFYLSFSIAINGLSEKASNTIFLLLKHTPKDLPRKFLLEDRKTPRCDNVMLCHASTNNTASPSFSF